MKNGPWLQNEPVGQRTAQYGRRFESQMMDLSVHIPLERALDGGWEILAECFEPEETGLRSELIREFLARNGRRRQTRRE